MSADYKEIYNILLDKSNAETIWTLAMVSDSSYEILFYAKIREQLIQSNEMVEQGIIDISDVDSYYNAVVLFVRQSSRYITGKMNIVKLDGVEVAEHKIDEINCNLFKVRKDWKSSVLREA